LQLILKNFGACFRIPARHGYYTAKHNFPAEITPYITDAAHETLVHLIEHLSTPLLRELFFGKALKKYKSKNIIQIP
jgi:hypothetical protein